MKILIKLSVYLVVFVAAISQVQAGFQCKGPLRSYQLEGLKHFFEPTYSAKLSHKQGTRVQPKNFYKKLTAAQQANLSGPAPKIAAEAILTQNRAQTLKSYLNENANATIPGWFTTSLAVVVPNAWIGLATDATIQLFSQSGSAGRLKLANLAGTVSENGRVGVLERVVTSSDGGQKFVWSYIYTANLNGKDLVALLMHCSADVSG